MHESRQTIIISSAGTGTRLKRGIPKALLDIDGKPLIIRQLELLDGCSDIRVVVGYQALRVMETVNAYRKDVLFAYNPNYQTTGTAGSFLLAAGSGREYCVALDGDLLVDPADMKRFLNTEDECIGACAPTTDEPVLITPEYRDGCLIAREFSRQRGSLEWTGLARIRRDHLPNDAWHVYHMLEPLLPLPLLEIRTQEIDTEQDYQRALAWFHQKRADYPECGRGDA